ncbi:MAG: hypothetical protein F4037_13420 [Gemmatimonadales bacterium]|nr:hypothetical protein [Candidatus Palauibacter ramosifaciens]
MSHVDFVEIGRGTIADAGTVWQDTGIALPTPAEQGIVVRVVGFTTALFRAGRLTALEPVTAGASSSGTPQIPLTQLGVSADFWSTAFGRTADGNLAITTLGVASTSTDVIVWHLEPHDIEASDLGSELLARILPVPTEATRGRYIRQSPDGETYELTLEAPEVDVTALTVADALAVLSLPQGAQASEYQAGGTRYKRIASLLSSLQSEVDALVTDDCPQEARNEAVYRSLAYWNDVGLFRQSPDGARPGAGANSLLYSAALQAIGQWRIPRAGFPDSRIEL